MSRLQQTNNGVIDNTINKQLEPWINNPPAYEDMVDTYKELGRTKAAIIKQKREIQRIEDQVSIDIDKPRSNEAKKAKLEATSVERDVLAELEARLEIIDADVKILEFKKTMFNAANFRMRLQEQYA